MNTFREALIAARKAKGFTQEQLAEKLNTSRPTISHWENGRAEPDMETLAKLSAILECDFLAWFGGTKPQEAVEETAAPIEIEKMPEPVQPGGESAAPEANPVQAAEKPISKTPFRKRWLLLIPVICILAALGALLLNQQPEAHPKMQPQPEPVRGSKAWFQAAEADAPMRITFNKDVAYVIHDDYYPNGLGWHYTVCIILMQDTSVQLDQIQIRLFGEREGMDITETNSVEKFYDWFDTDTVTHADKLVFNGGCSYIDVQGVGVYAAGTDPDGKRYEARNYLPFSREARVEDWEKERNGW